MRLQKLHFIAEVEYCFTSMLTLTHDCMTVQTVDVLQYHQSYMLYQTVISLLVTLSSLTLVKPDIDFPTTSHVTGTRSLVTGSRATVSTGRVKCPTASVCSNLSVVHLITQILIVGYSMNIWVHCTNLLLHVAH